MFFTLNLLEVKTPVLLVGSLGGKHLPFGSLSSPCVGGIVSPANLFAEVLTPGPRRGAVFGERAL